MTTSGNGTGNLLDEFEQCFMSIMQVLSREEENFDSLEKDEVHVDIEQATLKFVDIGRQLEAFFLQKRFLLSVLKPELIVKEEISELKNELARKDDLIKRHYEKIAVWQNILSDVQGRGKSPAQSTNQPLGFPVSSGTSGVGTPMPESGDNFINLFQQQQMQHQHMQQTQQQQQLQQFQQQQMQQQQMQQQAQIQQQQMQQQQAQIQQQQMASQMQQQQQIVSQMQQSQQIPTQMQQQQMPSQLQQQQQMQSQQIPSQMQQQQMSSPMQPQQMPSPMSQQQMPSPMQQQQMPPQMQQQPMPPQQIPGSMGPSSVSGGPGAMMTPQQAIFMQQQRMSQFSSNTSPSILAGPLAFLEKTTSNIGMSDGRR